MCLRLWSCFSAAGTEGLVRAEEKLNAPKYRNSLNENPVQSTQSLRLGRRFNFQQDNEPKHTARVAYRQLCECPWVDQPEPELEPNQIFLEKPENVLKKKTLGTSAKYLFICEYLCNLLISVFLFVINLQSCDNSVFALSIWCMECRLM